MAPYSFLLVLLITSTSCCGFACNDEAQDAFPALILLAASICQLAWASGMCLACLPFIGSTSLQPLFLRIRIMLEILSRPLASAFVLAVGFLYLQPQYGRTLPSSCPSSRALWEGLPTAGVVAVAVAFFLIFLDRRAARRSLLDGSCISKEDYSRGMRLLNGEIGADDDGNREDICQGLHLVDVEIGADEHYREEPQCEDAASLPEFESANALWMCCCCLKQEGLRAAFYSTMVAVLLATSQNLCTMGPIMAALAIRHFFEGLSTISSLGKVASWSPAWALRNACVSLSVPVGLLFGMVIHRSMPTTQVDAILQPVAAFVLAFAACEDLLHTHNSLQVGMRLCKLRAPISAVYYSAVLVGAGIMPFLANSNYAWPCNLKGHFPMDPSLSLALRL